METDKKDTYITLEGLSEGLYKDKGSRFLSFAMPVETKEEAKETLEKYRKKYHDARHVCYAYVIGKEEEGRETRQSDDGEPSGTAGRPMLSQIQQRGLTDTMVIVVRYFGGVLLGTGGLVVAYRESTADALEKGKTVERIVEERMVVEFGYERMETVMRTVKEEGIRIVKTEYGEGCRMEMMVRKGSVERVRGRFIDIRY